MFCWWHPILSHELLFTVISLRLWLDKSRRLLVIRTTIRIYFVSMFIGWEPLKVHHIYTDFPWIKHPSGFFQSGCPKILATNVGIPPCFHWFHSHDIPEIGEFWTTCGWYKKSPLVIAETISTVESRKLGQSHLCCCWLNLYPHVWSCWWFNPPAKGC